MPRPAVRRALGAAALALLVCGCGRLGLAPRFLSRCPARGLEVRQDLGLLPVPLDLPGLYAEIQGRSDRFEITELGVVGHAGRDFPILLVRPRPATARTRVVVVAGIHGDEGAGLRAVPAILDLLASDRAALRAHEVAVIAPANPSGADAGSRYNGRGCDVNRDFGDPRTREGRMLRDFIASQQPEMIIALHEGPQDGYLLVATSRASKPLAQAAVRAVEQRGFGLASDHFWGFSLGTPGLSAEGRGTDFLKWLLGLRTLGWYAASLGIGTYTTETSWSSDDFAARASAHVVTVEALLLGRAPAGGP